MTEDQLAKKFVELKLAKKFAKLLKAELGEDKMVAVIARNRTSREKKVCHSHYFTDANMSMKAACDAIGLKDDEHLPDIWNNAWDYAKKNEFWFRVYPEGKTTHTVTDKNGVPLQIEATIAGHTHKIMASFSSMQDATGFIIDKMHEERLRAEDFSISESTLKAPTSAQKYIKQL